MPFDQNSAPSAGNSAEVKAALMEAASASQQAYGRILGAMMFSHQPNLCVDAMELALPEIEAMNAAFKRAAQILQRGPAA